MYISSLSIIDKETAEETVTLSSTLDTQPLTVCLTLFHFFPPASLHIQKYHT